MQFNYFTIKKAKKKEKKKIIKTMQLQNLKKHIIILITNPVIRILLLSFIDRITITIRSISIEKQSFFSFFFLIEKIKMFKEIMVS